jgi:membrane-associated phospholipid phosphatase
MYAVLALTLSWRELLFWQGLLWAAVYGFLVSLLPILVVVYKLRKGQISDLHMSDTRERRIPYITSVVGSVIALAMLSFLDGPELVRCFAILSTIVLFALAVITRFWLISIHAAGIASVTLVTGLIFGWWTMAFMAPILVLVCAVRLYLRRHDITQVVAGLALGVAAVWLVVQIGCY